MSSAGREEIVDKLHGALAAFRRERDDLHRKKELATERLRLVTEEREAMEKTIRSMQEKLNNLNKSASEEAKAGDDQDGTRSGTAQPGGKTISEAAL